MKALMIAAWLLTAQATPPAADPAPASRTGSIAGAPYRIDFPSDWNGDLVMLFHGYEVVGQPRETPWPKDPATDIFLARGFAVATSGYSGQGWAIEEAIEDSRRLREFFEATYGRPGRLFAAGFSMGGHIALAKAEQEPEAFDGALSLCGVNMSASTLFGAAMESVEAFDVLFPGVLGMAEGGIDDPLSPPLTDQEALIAALASDPAKAELLARRMGVQTDHVAGVLWLYYAALREIADRAGGSPRDTRNIVYRGYGDDAAFNDAVRRYAASPEAVAYLADHSALTGRIEDPVVLLSNAYDDLVPTRLDGIYPALVAHAGRAELIEVLPRQGSGHCNFTPEQVGSAFDALLRKAEGQDR